VVILTLELNSGPMPGETEATRGDGPRESDQDGGDFTPRAQSAQEMDNNFREGGKG
jgi:hypothetical protein